MYGGSTAPSGWQLCDGATPVTTALQTLLGGAGQTVPDLRNRFVVGSGSNYALKATGGSADATLVAHGHTINDPGHFHTTNDYVSRAGYAEPRNFGVGTDGNANNVGNTNSKTTGITINSNGSSATNANLPPYYALTYIIKY
mgnify:FL=1|jgi:microcystin-dependent protein